MHIRVQKYAETLRNKKKDTMESPNMKLLRKVGLSGVKFSIVDEYNSATEMWEAEENIIKDHSQNPNCLNANQRDPRIRKKVQKMIRSKIMVNQRCMKCQGCENWRRKINCKKCKHCLDQKKYGGQGKLKKLCIEQYCNKI